MCSRHHGHTDRQSYVYFLTCAAYVIASLSRDSGSYLGYLVISIQLPYHLLTLPYLRYAVPGGRTWLHNVLNLGEKGSVHSYLHLVGKVHYFVGSSWHQKRRRWLVLHGEWFIFALGDAQAPQCLQTSCPFASLRICA